MEEAQSGMLQKYFKKCLLFHFFSKNLFCLLRDLGHLLDNPHDAAHSREEVGGAETSADP